MDKRIKIFCAVTSTEYIRFYSNKEPNWYCEGKIIDNTHVSINWKEEKVLEQKKTFVGKISLLKKIISKLKGLYSLFYAQKLGKTLLKMLMFFLIFPAIPLYGGYIDFTLLLLTIGLVSLIGEFAMFAYHFLLEYRSNTRSKHTAEHKLVNILEKLQRLPNNFNEIEKMTRFSKNCGDEEEKKIYEDYAKGILRAVSYILVSPIVFIERKIEISLFDILCFFTFRFLLDVIFLKALSLLINMLSQVASTTRKPDENDLMLAWVVAEEWMKEEYPEYFQEN